MFFATADSVLSSIELRGKRILVTGATAGIGWETARALAARGAEVHVGGRNPEKAMAAIERIKARHPDAIVLPFVADLADLDACERPYPGLSQTVWTC